jgi:hypothetical protein
VSIIQTHCYTRPLWLLFVQPRIFSTAGAREMWCIYEGRSDRAGGADRVAKRGDRLARLDEVGPLKRQPPFILTILPPK